ncbi:hypothetical protein HG536_0B02220 [Torulaspora globosa]|uniref:NEDD8-activating enzyme E1 catalytic subunit n=1 Tax=Torulaspora globosa TaxID=48254 RepID=A0A7G3ZCX3_9SACH|nr:uncharacterized protein HG536_0B02220 [Torulaspora globosa]QLL31359.1 hypothetical protein HG536_0B02220 [Torulaspora globosa]
MDCKILVLGAGGLGCEVLKNLAMSNVREIHVVDIDTIELTNLNRQFLFRDSDIGKPKAEVAASYINRWSKRRRARNPDAHEVLVVPHVQDLTLLPAEFFTQFQFVVSGLDSIGPRRYANEMVVRIARDSKYETCIPLIDGGTEGLKGHVKTVIPGITACWECSLDTIPAQQDTYPLCTIANNPRNLEHVISYAVTVSFPEANLDDPQDIQRLFDLSLERARAFNIDAKELTIEYLLGVVKHIIPSCSSTNSIVAAACTSRIVSIYYDLVDFDTMPTFTVFNGSNGFFTHSFQYQRNADCIVCKGL